MELTSYMASISALSVFREVLVMSRSLYQLRFREFVLIQRSVAQSTVDRDKKKTQTCYKSHSILIYTMVHEELLHPQRRRPADPSYYTSAHTDQLGPV
jgi:hypothetical protein